MKNERKEAKEQEYEQMMGEFLRRMACIEYELTILITELVQVTHHSEEFQDWFVKAPIPFNCKADFFMALVKEDTQLDQFRTLISSLRSLNNFRNTLAHSFHSFDQIMTSRGGIVPYSKVSENTLRSRLAQIRAAEDLIKYMRTCIIEGAQYPISADDFADSPM